MAKITRYAPSPTGRIHLGHVKASFIPYAIARNSNGKFILRIEDTDHKRNKPEAVSQLLEDLKWLNIDYDFGPNNADSKNDYFQSQRQEIYNKFIDQLLSEDKAYLAYDTPEEREEQIKIQRSSGKFPVYFGEKLVEEIEKAFIIEGRKPVVRLKVPRNEIIVFEDKVYGKVSVNTNQLGDLVIQKSDGTPMYNFCVVIDDHLMKITDVARGFGHLSNTSKQVLVYKIFGWEVPEFIHFSDIQNENALGKLSKRHGAKSIAQFRAEGYLPDALLNYVVNISTSSQFATKDEEILNREQFITNVIPKKLLHTNAKFNTQKLDWFNGLHIRRLSNDEFINKVMIWLKNYSRPNKEYLENFDIDLIEIYLSNEEVLKKTLPLIKERVTKFIDIIPYLKFFFIPPSTTTIDITPAKHTKEEFEQVITKIYNKFIYLNTPWVHEDWETTIRSIGDEAGWKHGDVFMALRLKIVGSPFSPPLFESMEILGIDECLKRIRYT